MPSSLTNPSERGAFFMMMISALLLMTAVFFIPRKSTGSGGEGDQAAAAGATSRPASGPATRASTQPSQEAPASRPASTDQAGLNAADFPAGLYAGLLDRFLVEDEVDYGALKADGRNDLKELVKTVEETDPRSIEALDQHGRDAWYVNAYNILTLDLIVDNYPLDSIMDLEKPWDTKMTVAREELTLNEVEHNKLRFRQGEQSFRERRVDPRLHFAVNCASIGCPNLQEKPYTAGNLDALYEEGVREFVAEPENFRFENGTLYLSELLNWYGEDFTLVAGLPVEEAVASLRARGVENPEVNAAVGAFFADYVENGETAAALRTGAFDLEWLTYDWNLNDTAN